MIKRLLLIFWYAVRLVYAKSVHHEEDFYVLLESAARDLGGIYVKLLQFACLRTDMFSDQQRMRLLSFYDAVATEPLDVVRILDHELGRELAKQFTQIKSEPFASGTFGQVYRAMLADGTAVIVKVKREDLIPKLYADFVLIKIASWIVRLLYDPKIVDVGELVAEFEAATYQELDYREEANNAIRFARIYAGHPRVVIPKTYVSLSTNRILVQEYVGGLAVTSLLRLKAEGGVRALVEWLARQYQTDLHTVIEDIAYDLGMQGLTEDVFYADPHPGNLKILPGNRFAIVDFGIVGTSPKNKRNYYTIINLLLKRADELDTQKLGSEFLRWGAAKLYRHVRTLDDYFSDGAHTVRHALEEKYAQMLEEKRDTFRWIERTQEENFVEMYLAIIKSGRLLGVRVPAGMLATMKTVAVFKAWVTYLDPHFHFMRGVYHRIVRSVDESHLVDSDVIAEKTVSLEDAIESVLDWTGDMVEHDPSLYARVAATLKNVTYV